MPDPRLKVALRQAIQETLRSSQGDRLSDELRGGLAEALADEHFRLESELERDRERLIDRPIPFTGDKGIYPIHDSDLKLMDESTAVAVAVGAAASSGWLGVLTKLVCFHYRLRRKRGRLEGEPALTLLALKDAPEPGWTVRQVRDHLKTAYGLDRSENRVLALLQGLQDVRLNDGTRTRFADEQHDRWFTVDV
jgi:hypothetical protein